MNKTNKNEDSGKFDFVGKAGLFGGISLALVVVSLVYLAVRGLTYGIDFSGGTELQVKFGQEVQMSQLRTLVEKQAGVQNAGVQAFGEGYEYIIRFQTAVGKTDKETNENQTQAVAQLRESIASELSAQQPEIRRVDSVGPQVGAELKRNGVLAVFYCLLVILIYVGLRFDYKYAPGAVICLAHDAIITLAIFVITGREVNVAILAAVLTLIGYSLNDTIVVFDRIRETESQYAHRGLKFVINKAINDMFWRTLITSGTTFVAALSLFLFAGGTISDIAFAMCVGIFFGTYSSIYVAAPLMLVVEKLKSARAVPA
jgi:preprotein translocase subunit SecF